MLLKKIGYFSGLNREEISKSILVDKINYPRERVLAYLKSGVEIFAWLEYVSCMYSCVNKNVGFVEYSDGVWVWTSEFIHYVEFHDIAIPESFLNYMESRSFLVSDSESLSLLDGLSGDPAAIEELISYSDQYWKSWIVLRSPACDEMVINENKENKNTGYQIPDDW